MSKLTILYITNFSFDFPVVVYDIVYHVYMYMYVHLCLKKG